MNSELEKVKATLLPGESYTVKECVGEISKEETITKLAPERGRKVKLSIKIGRYTFFAGAGFLVEEKK